MRARLVKILLLLFLSTYVAWPVVAQQESMDMSTIQEIPTYESELSPQKFLDDSALFEEEPMGDKFLAYKVRLPKGWVKSNTSADNYKKDEIDRAKISQRILGLIAKYYGPGRIDELSRFEIIAQGLDFEVTAKNWFMQEVLTRGYVLEGLEVISDRRVEALFVMVEKDTSFIVRAAAEINGPRIIVASYFVPERHWEKERAYQQRAVESFQFNSPEKNKIEMTRSHAFLDLVTFDYPASWRLVAPNIHSVEVMEATLLYTIDEKTLGGEIHISILSSEYENSLTDEIEYLKQEMTNRALLIGDLIEDRSKEYKLPPYLFYNKTEAYKVADSKNKILAHEYWLAIMEEERYFYVITMLTPSRTSEFYAWARNAEAFETVAESFRIPHTR